MQILSAPGIFVACAIFSAHSVTLAQYTPWAEEEFPMNLYWGDTHVHSAYSVDANNMGNENLTPEDAYRFARGEAVTASNGMQAKLNVPLDFLVVSDHSELLGTLFKLREGDKRMLSKPALRRLNESMSKLGVDEKGQRRDITLAIMDAMSGSDKPLLDNPEVSSEIWQSSVQQADLFNDPGSFTALIGFEWSSTPDANNLHRVVVFADGAEKAGLMQPISSNDGDQGKDPASLWAWMERYERVTGGRILAIPHNGNMSNGLMFESKNYAGKPIDAAYARRRARLEPIVEVTQIKGDGETHPFLSPDDEFADFETLDSGNMASGIKPNKENWMLQHEYARSALKLGLAIEGEIGINPYQFGMIGSTDSHTSLATAAEDNYWGKASIQEPGSERISDQPALPIGSTRGWELAASGLTAVWARDNTRAEIFDAMLRKEVYATTGSRIGLRFFGGWEFSDSDARDPHLARIGYRKGVPMGDVLSNAGSSAPGFLVFAAKDPHGANLDRVQIVKGWLDADDKLHERVFNVAVSDNRRISRAGKVKPLKHTVDVDAASYSNRIGSAQLSTFWQDPDFDPLQRAFYYARVLEIPVPRWTTYDAVRLQKEPSKNDSTKIIQDRAYSSPIWYNP